MTDNAEPYGTDVHNLNIELQRKRIELHRSQRVAEEIARAMQKIAFSLASLQEDIATGAILAGPGFECSKCHAIYRFLFNFCPDCGQDHGPVRYEPGHYSKIIRATKDDISDGE